MSRYDTTRYDRALASAIATEGLIKRHIIVSGRRTSMKLEQASWDALNSVASLEGVSIHDIATMIEERREERQSLTRAIRVFVVAYLAERFRWQ